MPKPRHPRAAALADLVHGNLEAAERNRVVRHLLTGCERCRGRLSTWLVLATPLPLPRNVGRRGPSDSYDSVIDRSLALVRKGESARKRALDDVLRLAVQGSAPPPPLYAVSGEESPARPFEARGRALGLLDGARALRSAEPAHLDTAASAALGAAMSLPSGSLPGGEVADLQARAWAEVGNARRRLGDLAAAESAFAAAMACTRAGSGSPRLLAELLDLSSSLWIDLRRFDEAERQLALAHRLYEISGDHQGAGKALVQLGIQAGYANDAERAVAYFTRSLAVLDPARDPGLAVAALFNALTRLVELERFEQAAASYQAARETIAEHFGAADRIKLDWLGARIELGLGRLHRAEVGLRQARRAFTKLDMPYYEALASLDLCQVWLREGRTGEVRETATALVAAFTARGVEREAIAAVILFEEAARQERATVELVLDAARAVGGLAGR